MHFLRRFHFIFNGTLRRVVSGLLCCVLLLPGTVSGSAAKQVFADGTFIQLIQDDARWTSEQWQDLFQQLHVMGIREIVVQWTRYGEADLMPLAHTVLDLAAQWNMRVWVGLYTPEDWWQGIRKPPQLLEVYLWKIMREQTAQARTVWAAFGGHPALAGLYLPIEIDDGTWHDEARTRLLCAAFDIFARHLAEAVPACSLAISGFSNGIVPPDALAEFWTRVLAAGHVQRLYFQDGVGVNKLSPEEAAVYTQALVRTLTPKGYTVRVVVEAFTQVSGPPLNTEPFAAKPAPLARLERQVTLARKAGASGATFFTVPNYMSVLGGEQAENLGRQWLHTLSRRASSF